MGIRVGCQLNLGKDGYTYYQIGFDKGGHVQIDKSMVLFHFGWIAGSMPRGNTV